jgi:hypothetical protein
MYILIGIRSEPVVSEDGRFVEIIDMRDQIARFDTEELAFNYIEASKSAKYQEQLKPPLHSRINQFKKNSLLYGYHWAEIKKVGHWLPLNPKLGEKYE